MSKITQPFVKAALELSDNGQSKLNEREREVYGLSSTRLRSLINNLCSKPDTNYLEVGTYRGATLISAAYGNPTCKVVGIDNFMYDEREPKRVPPKGYIWDNMKSQLEANLGRYADSGTGLNIKNISFIQSDFQSADLVEFPSFDLCFFDVSPVNAAIYDDFFNLILTKMSATSVVVFSAYSNVSHAKELDEAFSRHADKVDVAWKEQRISNGTSDSTQYFSGIGIFGITKKAIAKPVVKPVAVTKKS